jgi:non-heme chloroperoxidase
MTTARGPLEEQIGQANASGRTPVVFIHGLWLLASSWDRWADLFAQAGYAPVIGHSFGGLLAQIVARRGLAAVTVAIDPAPFRGVPQLPLSSLRAGSPVLDNPANRHRAVPLTYEQFRYSSANAVDEEQARRLFDTFAVPAPGAPLWQAAAANFNPRTEDKVNTGNPDRGPMLIVSGEKDHTVPHVLAYAAYGRQRENPGVTEFTEIPNRGHALTIDDGWQEVADTAFSFVQSFA